MEPEYTDTQLAAAEAIAALHGLKLAAGSAGVLLGRGHDDSMADAFRLLGVGVRPLYAVDELRSSRDQPMTAADVLEFVAWYIAESSA